MKVKHLLTIFILVNAIGWPLFYYVQPLQKEVTSPMPAVAAKVETNSESNWINTTIHDIKAKANNINANVLKLSLIAYQKAQKMGLPVNSFLTVIDYSKPSTEKRLWVIDLSKKEVLFNTLVAHGKNTGNVQSSSFSNTPSSLQSSLGVFITGDTYIGKHGKSLRVKGLEAGVNDNAYSRSIVFHGANYVSPSIAKTGRIGRSWGCMAVSEDVIQPLINTIKNKTLVFAYYPDKKWLNKSTYLS